MNSKLGRQHTRHTKAPLAAALSPFVSLLYPPSPWCEWCDVWRLTTTPGSTSSTLFEQWCGFFYVPQEPDSVSAVRRDLRFSSLSEKNRKSNRSLMSLQRHHFLLSYLKTLSVGPGRGSIPWPPAQQTGALPTELTSVTFILLLINYARVLFLC